MDRYGLKDNDIILADPEKHGKLIEDMEAIGSIEYSAGGAGLNSLRCAQVKSEYLRVPASFIHILYCIYCIVVVA